MANPQEVAVLVVNGRQFRDWTSVLVEQRFTEWFPIFQFECTEELDNRPTSKRVAANLQIKPGDIVEVTLGGQSALLGYVVERHVGYDARNHGVKIVGVGKTWDLTNTSVFSQGGSYDNQSWSQFANALIGPSGVKLKEVGAVDSTPFENIHVQPGEIISQALERYARMRKIVLGSSPHGDLLAVGDNSASPVDSLIEGQNILQANGVIKDENVYRRIYAIGQQHGNDDHNGDASNKQIAHVDGSSSRNRIFVVPTDISDSQHGVQQRAEMEKVFTEGGSIEINITVQGWLRRGGQLWRAGEYYTVKSPMLMMNQALGCKTATFEQDSRGGTRTTLHMVDPYHMNGKPNMSGSSPTQ
jgi:prophage tail gpP-like protein